jgi:hypothetical protein
MKNRIASMYQIFSMNYEKNPSAAERAKQLILEKYPYTSYSEFVKNPKKADFSMSDSEVVEKNLYTMLLLFTPKKNLTILKN